MNRTEDPDLRHDADMAAFADMAKTDATFAALTKPEPYIPGAEHLQMRWRCLREVVTGMQQASLTLAAEFPQSCEGDRADTLRLVLRAMRQIEANFPGVTA